MILLEVSPPFQLKPSWWRSDRQWRFIWLWFGVGYLPGGWNEMIKGIARAGASLACIHWEDQVCTREAMHTGPCNGIPSYTCNIPYKE